MKLRIIAGILFIFLLSAGMGYNAGAAPRRHYRHNGWGWEMGWRRPHAAIRVYAPPVSVYEPPVRVYVPPVVVDNGPHYYHHAHHYEYYHRRHYRRWR